MKEIVLWTEIFFSKFQTGNCSKYYTYQGQDFWNMELDKEVLTSQVLLELDKSLGKKGPKMYIYRAM